MKSIPSMLAAMLVCAAATRAVPPLTVVSVPAASVTTKNLALLRGTHVRLEGSIPSDLGACHIVVDAGGQLVSDQPNALSRWRVDWDSTDATAKSVLLRVQATKGARRPVTIGLLYIDLYDKPPFSLTAVPPSDTDKSHITFTIAPTGSASSDRIQAVVDGHDVPADFTGLTGKISTANMPTGSHEISARVMLNDSPMLLTPATVVLPSHVAISGDSTVIGATSPLHVACAPDQTVHAASVTYVLDGAPAGSASRTPYETTIDLSNESYGAHTVYADVVDETGSHYLSPALSVTLTPAATKSKAAARRVPAYRPGYRATVYRMSTRAPHTKPRKVKRQSRGYYLITVP